MPAKFFNGPNALNAEQFKIENARAGQAMCQQRLGFLRVGAMDDAILLRAQTRANRFGEIRMSGQNQKRFHLVAVPNGPNLFSVGVTTTGLCTASGFRSIHYWLEACDKIAGKWAIFYERPLPLFRRNQFFPQFLVEEDLLEKFLFAGRARRVRD